MAAALKPVSVLAAFDSLLEAGDFPAAKALCTGQMLRMFDFLAMAQSQMAGLVDSAKSSEDTLEDSISGDWAYVKLASRMVFRRPFLGQTGMNSIQAVHLYRSGRGWLIAEFQELESPKDPVRFRTGRPSAPDSSAGGPASQQVASMFPVSPLAPETPGQADWIRYRARLRNGAALADICPTDAYQKRTAAPSASEWVLENRSPGLPRRAGGKRPPVTADSLRPYLASNAYLDLEDTLLKATARRARGSETDPVQVAGAIRKWVTGAFRFNLGAVLFGTSREVLRDMTGDCSEAAILTAALLRSSGVPSRVALGFASAGRGVFIGHAWTEAWLGPKLGWVGVDAALAQYPAGVERIKLMNLDGRADMRIAATNLMLAALSNLDIEILEARRGGRSLPLVAHPGAVEEGMKFFAEILKGLGSP